MAAALPHIRYIIDMDGFRVAGKFMCRELGVFDLKDNCVFNYFFEVGDFFDLDDKDRRSASYCFRRIHGLMFGNKPRLTSTKVFSQTMLGRIIEMLVENAGNEFIAYKGGQCEKEKLEICPGARYINLEHYGCPKFNDLLIIYNIKVDSCGEHYPVEKWSSGIMEAHCPMKEVCYFAKWWNERCSEHNSKL